MSPSISVAPPGPALRAFIDSRRVAPWPQFHSNDYKGVRASKLYEAYAEAMKADDRVVLSARDFGMTLKDEGFTSERDSAGNTYPGFFDRTREEVALADVTESLTWKYRSDRWRELEEAHRDDTGHEWDCRCDLRTDANFRLVWDAVAAYEQQLTDDGTIAATIEERYGRFLRWRHGDANPRVLDLQAAYPVRAAELDAMQARWDAQDPSVNYSELGWLRETVEMLSGWLDADPYEDPRGPWWAL